MTLGKLCRVVALSPFLRSSEAGLLWCPLADRSAQEGLSVMVHSHGGGGAGGRRVGVEIVTEFVDHCDP